MTIFIHDQGDLYKNFDFLAMAVCLYSPLAFFVVMGLYELSFDREERHERCRLRLGAR